VLLWSCHPTILFFPKTKTSLTREQIEMVKGKTTQKQHKQNVGGIKYEKTVNTGKWEEIKNTNSG
jgi:hypothetical protein